MATTARPSTPHNTLPTGIAAEIVERALAL
jgi:hypothetical protein